MTKSQSSLDTPLSEHLRKLATFEPQDAPVVSLYLNLAPDQRGRDNYEGFCRKAFAEQLRAFKENETDHANLARDIERITAYLANEVNRSANGLAIFSSAGAMTSSKLYSSTSDRRPLAVHRPGAAPLSVGATD